MSLARTLAAAPGLTAATATAVALLRSLVRSLRSRVVTDVPFSSLFGGRYVGPEWASGRAITIGPAPGEVEDFSIYDRPGFDSSDVHPEIRRFYERTAEYALSYETTWHRGFRTGAWLASFLTGRIEQLNLPGRSAAGVRTLESRIAFLDTAVDGRDARVWTRTDPETGEAVFVAVYATHERDGVTYANVAVPLPGTNLSTVLRPDALDAGSPDGGAGVRFTTRGVGDGGLYLVSPVGTLALPMAQSFRVWPAAGHGGPIPPVDGAVLVATHEMWLCGRQFLTIRYGIEPAETT
ncbi:hypothetical protein [Natrononativus amylolyticus]|uniref:hypothetical protein n=1 Tax=Natrononativus amylolyticus TaxID=2963434 RepID=UPI0020CF3272|nr:hypothetical protein [Natrononativus amylolyticus]